MLKQNAVFDIYFILQYNFYKSFQVGDFMIIIWIKEKVSSLGFLVPIICVVFGILFIISAIAAVVVIPDVLKLMFEHIATYVMLILLFITLFLVFIKKAYVIAIIEFSLFVIVEGILVLPAEFAAFDYGILQAFFIGLTIIVSLLLCSALITIPIAIIPFITGLIVNKIKSKS